MKIGDLGAESNRDRPRTAASTAKSMDGVRRDFDLQVFGKVRAFFEVDWRKERERESFQNPVWW